MRTKWMDDIAGMLPMRAQEALANIPKSLICKVDEIRLRANRPLMLTNGAGDYFVCPGGQLQRTSDGALQLTQDEIHQTFEAACEHSIYAFEEELRYGFLTIKGGYRVGVAGRVNVRNEKIFSLAQCSGLCFRISREVRGCADGVMPHIWDGENVHASLIVSPPMMGKTTMLRDIARQLSDGVFGQGGEKVCVVDERSEIAGSVGGVPQLDVGLRTDVLDACPKAYGLMMALRSLSPDVIVTDELGGEQDSHAVMEAAFSGVKVIASAHGHNEQDVLSRSGIQTLYSQHAFDRYIILGGQPGQVTAVLDSTLQPIGGRRTHA